MSLWQGVQVGNMKYLGGAGKLAKNAVGFFASSYM